MIRKAIRVAILISTIGLSGCTTVFSTRPLGLPIWSEMQGTWQVGDGSPKFYEVRLLPDGSMPIAWTEWNDDENRFTLSTGELVVTIDEGATYVNFRGADDPERTFSFFRVLFLESQDVPNGPKVVLIAPNADLFQEATKLGTLSGEHDDFTTIVDGTQLADFVDPLKLAEQFDVAKTGSITLARRVANAPGPDVEATVLRHGRRAHTECLPEMLLKQAAADIHLWPHALRCAQECGREIQPDQADEMRAVTREQWARALNVDPQQRATFTTMASTPERRYEFRSDGLAIKARLAAAEFSSYLTCLDARGFGLVNLSGLQDDAGYGSFWVAKEGFGLFEFGVRVE